MADARDRRPAGAGQGSVESAGHDRRAGAEAEDGASVDRENGASTRRRFLTRASGAVGALLLGGCERLSHSEWFPKVLAAG